LYTSGGGAAASFFVNVKHEGEALDNAGGGGGGGGSGGGGGGWCATVAVGGGVQWPRQHLMEATLQLAGAQREDERAA